MTVQYRRATPHDAEAIARLHADSWRRHYRGAYSDAFLDGDVVADRRAVWTHRLGHAEDGRVTTVAEAGERLVGFAHVIVGDDPHWGALLDNLHVATRQRRSGIGSRLLALSAAAVVEQAPGSPLHLWVLEQNAAAQAFYAVLGGTCVERAAVSPPGGDASRLHGSPVKLRFAWPDSRSLTRP